MKLADYKSDPDSSSRYDYIVKTTETLETKLAVFKEFLLSVKEDCSVSITTKEPGQQLRGIDSIASSTSSDEKSSIHFGLNSDNREQNGAEFAALYQQWADVLDLSLNLEDRKRSTSYFVYKRISRVGKKHILKQFIDKYEGSEFAINAGYGGGTTLRITASIDENEKQVLFIDYLPQLPTEKEELKQAYEEYTSVLSE